jgi:peptidoglycan/LPS O-acetylase OafA/YrhL
MSISAPHPKTASCKPVYPVLDGIRGVAALLVVMRHTLPFFGKVSFQETYLAVDIFFLLSGYVIANAYEDRLRTGAMSFQRFSWIRLVRIYPLYLAALAVMSVVIALGYAPEEATGAGALMLLALLLLPSFRSASPVGLYPLDGPSWSLFFEMGVNFFYGKCARFLTDQRVLAILAFSAAGLVFVLVAGKHHNLDVGWTAKSFPGGFFRVGYSFFAGVLMYRFFAPGSGGEYGKRSSFLSWLILGALVALLALKPDAHWQPYYDFVCVAFLFPLLLKAALHGRPGALSTRLFLFLGETSYAVYVLHVPLSLLAQGVMRQAGLRVELYAPYAGLAYLCVLLPVAWRLHHRYDQPLRDRILGKRRIPVRPGKVLMPELAQKAA